MCVYQSSEECSLNGSSEGLDTARYSSAGSLRTPIIGTFGLLFLIISKFSSPNAKGACILCNHYSKL